MQLYVMSMHSNLTIEAVFLYYVSLRYYYYSVNYVTWKSPVVPL